MEPTLAALEGLPPWITYLLLGLGAAIENVVPPIPADTFVVLGGFLSARGPINPWLVWLFTWSFNVASALIVYGLAYRYGRPFFETGWGRYVLSEPQMDRVERFYERFGVWAILFTRFLPGLRSVVPAFAGVSRLGVLPVAVPILTASGLWYGGLVWAGAATSRNLDALLDAVDRTNTVLLAVAVALTGAIAIWWIRSRR